MDATLNGSDDHQDPCPRCDSLADAIALVECVRRRDPDGAHAIINHCDPTLVALLLARCLATAGDQWGVPADFFRQWGPAAAGMAE